MYQYEEPKVIVRYQCLVDVVCTSGLVDNGVFDDDSSDTPFIPQQ